MDDKCEEMCPPAKRKRVVLTLEQKLEVIRLKDDGKWANFINSTKYQLFTAIPSGQSARSLLTLDFMLRSIADYFLRVHK